MEHKFSELSLPVLGTKVVRNKSFTRTKVICGLLAPGKARVCVTSDANQAAGYFFFLYFFTFRTGKYNTRGNCYKLETKRSCLELRRNFLSQRVVTSWNKLPKSVVTAESVNAFKNRLDKE